MKQLSVLFVFICSLGFSQEFNKTHLDTVIPWSRSEKIEWKDFLGKLNPDIFAYAITSYKIDIMPEHVAVDANDNILNYQDLTVVANFYKKQSWTISKDTNLLNHERLHFDIAELFARKIRKRFSELKSLKEQQFSVYWDEYSVLWKACKDFQKQYDIETNHGAKEEENHKWSKKVNSQLDRLEIFALKR